MTDYPQLLSACENFFESWFGPPIGQPEHMVRILRRREQTKKEFADILFAFVRTWQKCSPEYNRALDSLEQQARIPNYYPKLQEAYEIIRLLLPLAKGYAEMTCSVKSVVDIIKDAEKMIAVAPKIEGDNPYACQEHPYAKDLRNYAPNIKIESGNGCLWDSADPDRIYGMVCSCRKCRIQ